jgi:GT2 family glycosyltransferase
MRALALALENAAHAKLNAELRAELAERAAAADLSSALGDLNVTRIRYEELSKRAAWLDDAVLNLQGQVQAIERSFTYRLMAPLRSVAHLARRVKRRMQRSGTPAATSESADPRLLTARQSIERRGGAYEVWSERYRLSEDDRLSIARHVATGVLPSIVVLVRIDVKDTAHIKGALGALGSQSHGDWTGWIWIPAECRSEHVTTAVEACVSVDDRLHVIENDEAALAQVDGAVVVVTSASAVLRNDALYLFSDAVEGGGRFAYGDSEMIDAASDVLIPVFKPGLSPIHQGLHGYIGTTFAIDNRDSSSSLALRELVAGRVDLPTTLQSIIAVTPSSAGRRIPFVVQRDTQTPIAADAVGPMPQNDPVRVSIIIPTRDRLELLEPCIDSLRSKTAYPSELMELIVVDNGSTDHDTLEYLHRGAERGDFVVLRDDDAFNYPRLNNRAAQIATGEVLVLLNNDTTVFDPDWLRSMVSYACDPGVGAVGGKLLYPDLSVQHGGVVLGVLGIAAHVNHMLSEEHDDYLQIADVTHETAAVTGACLAIRAAIFRDIGGLDESLAVSFNDIDMCCALLTNGYRNVYIGSPLMIHHESKSRGYDTTVEQVAGFRREAIRTRTKHPDLYRDDPYYNPNLSLLRPYELAEPPRGVRPWNLARRSAESSRCILILSSTYEVGHLVSVVVDMHARHLAALGHRVILGGQQSANELSSPGCERVPISSEFEAAIVAHDCGADVVMMHGSPSFPTARWLGSEQVKIVYDYGEPSSDLFADAAARRNSLADRRFSMALADSRFAISESVRAESGFSDMAVLAPGNSQFATWSTETQENRDATRERLGWTDKIVVLNVCRFEREGRTSKGVYTYASLVNVARAVSPMLAERAVFVLCGGADPDEAQEMDGWGMAVFANVSEDEMVNLYAAADIYVSLSKYEGYNLGIAQALAMGLPTLASDIPAHRELGIVTTDDVVAQVAFLEEHVARFGESVPERQARTWAWETSLEQLGAVIAAT